MSSASMRMMLLQQGGEREGLRMDTRPPTHVVTMETHHTHLSGMPSLFTLRYMERVLATCL